MSEQDNKPEKFLLQAPASAQDIEFFLWNNLNTGPILVGDTIRDEKSGKSFRVAERIWNNGKDVKAMLTIRLEESPE
ncbi:hypothetical protein ABN448_21875 [Delftia acidovorans]|jgi:hypothetical protein|uniref:hypothetical protein n=1 Tax=Delftia acidovorans TaxID=80866 RepID=UPI0032E04149